MVEKKDNFSKLRSTTKMMSFFMPHQEVLPDLKEIIRELRPINEKNIIDCNTDEYLKGAYDALSELIDFLSSKGHVKNT